MTEGRRDTLMRHEALDRAHMLQVVFSEFVREHPFIAGSEELGVAPNAELQALATIADDALFLLYQAIGNLPEGEPT